MLTSTQQSPEDVADANRHLSSPRSPVDQEQPYDLTPHQSVAIEEQQILHLVPCTWDEFLELDPPHAGYYDYVDGLVVWYPNMANAEHNDLIKYHSTALECCERRVSVYSTPSIQIISEDSTLQWTRDNESGSSNGAGASSSAQRTRSRFGMRHPDFAITKARRDSDGSSSTTRDPAVKERIQYPHPYSERLLAVVEITSSSTRSIDLEAKWRAYARSEVPLYVILDRGTNTKPKRVIVGSLERLSKDDEKSVSGDKQLPPKTRRTSDGSYYRMVYKPEDTVDCLYFSELDVTAAELLDIKAMRKLSTNMDNERRRQRELREIAERERDEERRERDEERRKRYEERRELERERDDERRKRYEERRELERERDEEKRKRKESDLKRKELEDRVKKAERKLDEDRRQRRSGTERDQETGASREGASRNPEADDEEAQGARKASAIKEGPPSSSSPKISPPKRKKRRNLK